MAKLSVIKCLLCGDVIGSFYRHDFRTCNCGHVHLDGGFDYTKIGWKAGMELEECVKKMDEDDPEVEKYLMSKNPKHLDGTLATAAEVKVVMKNGPKDPARQANTKIWARNHYIWLQVVGKDGLAKELKKMHDEKRL